MIVIQLFFSFQQYYNAEKDFCQEPKIFFQKNNCNTKIMCYITATEEIREIL